MSIKDFQFISKLGEGAYSTVYKVKRLSDKTDYALKRVKLGKLSEKEKLNALNEVRILASCRHPNLIAYKEAFIEESSNSLCIVMEFADHGDLLQKIMAHQKRGQLFHEEEIWNIFIQITKALKPLHEIKIFHRDLKSANVFINKDGTVKLGDMNVSKVAKKGLLYTQTGTPYYASPEVWKDQPYDHKSDIWSLGCVLYEMTTLKPPFRAEDMEGLYKKVIRGLYPSIPSHYSQDLNNLIRALLQVSPQLRPSAEKILQMSAVQKRMKEHHLTEVDDSEKSTLLKTIRFPKSLHILTDRLPKANYNPLKVVVLDKQKFVQTLAGLEDTGRQKERFDEHLARGSESVDTHKKSRDRNPLPLIKGAKSPNIFHPDHDKQHSGRNNNKKELAAIEELLEPSKAGHATREENIHRGRELRVKEDADRDRDREQKLREIQEWELKRREKEKDFLLRERAKQKAAEHSSSSNHLLLPGTTNSSRSSVSKQSHLLSNVPSTTTNTNTPTDYLSVSKGRDRLLAKAERVSQASQSINVATIKANQQHAGDGDIQYIQNKYNDVSSPLSRKSSEHLSTPKDLQLPKSKFSKQASDPALLKNKYGISPVMMDKPKIGSSYENQKLAVLIGNSPHQRLPSLKNDSTKGRLPPLKDSKDINLSEELARYKMKSLGKAYNVKLLGDSPYKKKIPKKESQSLGVDALGKYIHH